MTRSQIRRTIEFLERLAPKPSGLPPPPPEDEAITPRLLGLYWAAAFEAFGLDSVGRRLFAADHPERFTFVVAGVSAVDSEMHNGDGDVIPNLLRYWVATSPLAAVDPGRPSDAHDALTDGLIEVADAMIEHAQGRLRERDTVVVFVAADSP